MTTMNNEKSVFITGAAAGIGRATALTFAKNGYIVGGYDIDEVGLKSLADEIDDLGAKAVTGHLDVTDADEMAATGRRIRAGRGRPARRDDQQRGHPVGRPLRGHRRAGTSRRSTSTPRASSTDCTPRSRYLSRHAQLRRRQSGVRVGDLRPGRARQLQRDQVLRPRHHRGARHRMAPLRHPRGRDVAAVRADRDDRPRQDRHDGIARASA